MYILIRILMESDGELVKYYKLQYYAMVILILYILVDNASHMCVSNNTVMQIHSTIYYIDLYLL